MDIRNLCFEARKAEELAQEADSSTKVDTYVMSGYIEVTSYNQLDGDVTFFDLARSKKIIRARRGLYGKLTFTYNGKNYYLQVVDPEENDGMHFIPYVQYGASLISCEDLKVSLKLSELEYDNFQGYINSIKDIRDVVNNA